jgi:glyoxylase-like metal-dependent hydrolase (beta-lactamase superfamily II)
MTGLPVGHEAGFPVRVLAPNPGPFTLEGTNTWIVGTEPTIVVDPGPDDDEHLEEVRRSAGSVGSIVLTHHHPDHAPGAARLAALTGARVRAFDPGPGEERLRDGDILHAGGAALLVVHTPGHTPDHVVLFDPEASTMFTGDAVLGRGTSVIDPPEGDLAEYLDSLRRMRSLAPRVLCPGHGPVVWAGTSKLDEYLEHRAERERQVVEALERAPGPLSAEELVPSIYAGYPAEIRPAAARSVLAHLLALERAGRIARDRHERDRFALVDTSSSAAAPPRARSRARPRTRSQSAASPAGPAAVPPETSATE